MEMRVIRDAIQRLSCVGRKKFHFDPAASLSGDGPIHYLVEVDGLFFIAWEDNNTHSTIVNLITRFELEALRELGAEEAWEVLYVPALPTEGIQFREIDDLELSVAYCRMEEFASTQRTRFAFEPVAASPVKACQSTGSACPAMT